jgi:hypothetical protein
MLQSWSLFGYIHFPVGFLGGDLGRHRQSAVSSLDPREGVQHFFAQIRIGLELARRAVTSRWKPNRPARPPRPYPLHIQFQHILIT